MAPHSPSDNAAVLSKRRLVVGAKGSGKTSLLFQYALDLACQGYTSLLVCCSRDKMMAATPSALLTEKLCGDTKRSTEDDCIILQRILLKYVESEQQLRDLLVSFHLGPTVHALLIDDVDLICSTPATLPSTRSQTSPSRNVKQHAMMRLVGAVALAAHAADFLEAHNADSSGRTSSTSPAGSAGSKVALSQQRDHSKPSLIVALSPDSSVFSLLSRYLPTVMRIASLSQEPRNAGCVVESTCASLQAVQHSKLLFEQGCLHNLQQELPFPPNRLGLDATSEQATPRDPGMNMTP